MDRSRTTFGFPDMGTITKKGKIEVGKIYYGLPRGFQSLVRCEVLKIYENAAMVKIICCSNPLDDEKQIELSDVTLISLRSLKAVQS